MSGTKRVIHRRDFLLQTTLAGGGLLALPTRSALGAGEDRIRWTRNGTLFTAVACDGRPMVQARELLDASIRLATESAAPATRLSAALPASKDAPFHAELRHDLRNSGNGMGEDVLEAALTVHNTSDRPQRIEIEFVTSAQPSSQITEQHAYLPLSAAGLHGDQRFAALGVDKFLKDADQAVGMAAIQCNYLEPMASYAGERMTKVLLLAPVVDVSHPHAAWHVALFSPSDQPMRFQGHGGTWHAGREVTVPAGGRIVQRCWLMLHTGDASVAWRAFHRLAHREECAVPDWVRGFKVHYYDFLSSAVGANGPRGDGYEADLAHFREFQVGLATQHGYYPCMGDHIHPDRTTWLAMKGSKQGPVAMSFDKIKARIKATRAAGAKAGIYMHLTALDDSSKEFYPRLAGGRQIGADGQPVKVGWNGPDVKGGLWWMSMAAPEWREHLLQQAQWIMEIFNPDAIVMDETFSGLGYDDHPHRGGPLSSHAIEFFKKMRSLVRSFGTEKAFFTSDCSMSGFVLWADGECGDHAYPGLLGHPLYTQDPVRYLASLGDKPWRPCAWDFHRMWAAQMKLARHVGAGVGVSNGWIQYTGLAKLPDAARKQMQEDIGGLFARW